MTRCVGAGLDSLWWPDHLMALAAPGLWESGGPSERELHTYADPFVAMAACAEALGDTAVGTCVTDTIRRSPASLVQTAFSLDWAVAGPVLLGIGSGELANYRPYGIEIGSPAAHLDRTVRQIRKFLDDPGPDDEGAIVGIRARVADRPPQLWLAAHGPRSQRLTGELADGWLPTQLDPQTWSAGRDAVLEAAVAAGRAVDSVEIGMCADVVIAESRVEALRRLAHPVVKLACLNLPPSVFSRYGVEHPLGTASMGTMIPTRDETRLVAAARAVPEAVVRDHVIHGDVDDVVAAIGQYSGLEHLRLSDLGAAVGGGGGGGLDRLVAVADQLRAARR